MMMSFSASVCKPYWKKTWTEDPFNCYRIPVLGCIRVFAGYVRWHEPADLLQVVVNDHERRNPCDPTRNETIVQLTPIDGGWRIRETGQLNDMKVRMTFDSAVLGRCCENDKYILLL